MSQLIIKYEDVVLLTEELEDFDFNVDKVKFKQSLIVDGSDFIVSIANNSVQEANLRRRIGANDREDKNEANEQIKISEYHKHRPNNSIISKDCISLSRNPRIDHRH